MLSLLRERSKCFGLNIIFESADPIRLPNGAATTLFVELQEDEQICNEEGTSILLQLHMNLFDNVHELTADLWPNHRPTPFSPYGDFCYHEPPNRATMAPEGKEGTQVEQFCGGNGTKTNSLASYEQMFQTLALPVPFDFHRHPLCGLRPPGNPQADYFTLWRSKDFQKMDMCRREGNRIVISDFQPDKEDEYDQPRLRLIPTPARAISLFEALHSNNIEDTTEKAVSNGGREKVQFFDIGEPEEFPTTNSNGRISRPTLSECIIADQPDVFEQFLYFHPEEDELLTDLSLLGELHGSSREWLEHQHVPVWLTWDISTVTSLEVYTDGSFDGTHSSWAFVVVAKDEFHSFFVGFAGSRVQTEQEHQQWIGSVRHSSTTAELEAIFWSSYWIMRLIFAHQWKGKICFAWDAMTPGMKSQGLATMGDQAEQGLCARRVRQMQQALERWSLPQTIEHMHVKAHRGHPVNELVDTVAKVANLGNMSFKSSVYPGQFLRQYPCTIDWLWYYVLDSSHQQTLPQMRDGAITWNAYQARDFCPTVEWKQEMANHLLPNKQAIAPVKRKSTTFALRIATYNALSLKDKQMRSLIGDPGRIALLRDQCLQRKLHIVGLQETRTPAGMFASCNYFRFASGASDEGLFGVEIWFSRVLSIEHDESKAPIYFQYSGFLVCHSEPSILIVNYKDENLNMTVVSAHGPHLGQPAEIKNAWWEKLYRVVHPFQHAGRLIICIDANARLGPYADLVTGGRSDDQEDDNGERLRTFLHSAALFAPTTYDTLHEGENSTWIHPSGTSTSRLDYILLSNNWWHATQRTATCETIHSGHAAKDHLAVLAELCWVEQFVKHKNQRSTSFDMVAAYRPENRHKLQEIMMMAPLVPWDTNANEHARRLTEAFQSGLSDAFPRKKRAQPPRTVSEETQHCYIALTTAKRNNRLQKKMQKMLYLRVTFDAWSRSMHSANWRSWLQVLSKEEVRTTMEIRYQGANLKKRLWTDRKDYLKKIAEEAVRMPPSEVFKTLRPVLRPAKKRGNQVSALPMVKKKDGTLTVSKEEADARWLEHFAEMEAGQEIDVMDYLDQALQMQKDITRPTSWTVSELPEPWWIEEAVRRIKNGKVSGLDRVPGELLKASPKMTALVLLPILWKMMLRLEEPLVYKGGTISEALEASWIPLGVFQLSQCAVDVNNRQGTKGINKKLDQHSLYLSSDPMKLAGKAHKTVLFGSQMVRSFIQYQKQIQRTSIVIFADIASAFYMALRQIACGASSSDDDVAKICHQLGLPPEVMEELHYALHQAPHHYRNPS